MRLVFPVPLPDAMTIVPVRVSVAGRAGSSARISSGTLSGMVGAIVSWLP